MMRCRCGNSIEKEMSNCRICGADIAMIEHQDAEISEALAKAFEGKYYRFSEWERAGYVLTYLTKRDISENVPFNVLIQMPSWPGRALDYCQRLVSAGESLGLFAEKKKRGLLKQIVTGGVRFFHEEEILQGDEDYDKLLENCDMVIIDSAGYQATPEWDEFAKTIEKHPDTVVVLCADKNTIDTRFRLNEHLYYRVFADDFHISLSEYNADDATYAILQMLKDKGLDFTDEFVEAMHTYNTVIYPDADLRNEDYVQDMYYRIYRKHTASGADDIINVNDIPYSTKMEILRAEQEIQDEEAESSEEKEEITEECLEYVSIENKSNVNILLTALSTFAGNKELSKTVFVAPDGSEVIGRYQMDPVPKWLGKTLQEKGDSLDKIILLCTKKTTDTVEELKTPEGKYNDISPKAYYIRQIAEYFGRSIEDVENNMIVEISIDQNSPAAGISEAVTKIRECSKGKESSIYIDPHGGFRSIQLVTIAITSLLEEENIAIKDIYDVRYDKQSEDGKCHILKNDETVKIFQFVSGIHEFLNYGRIDSLKNYIGDSDEEPNRLLQAISKVSEGIIMCNMSAFEAGLKELRRYFSSVSNGNEDEYLKLFTKNIKLDYGPLLRKNVSTLEKVKWCLRKGFYQQAVTLIESGISEDLIKFGIIRECNIPPELSKNGKPCKNPINEVFNGCIYSFDARPTRLNRMSVEDYEAAQEELIENLNEKIKSAQTSSLKDCRPNTAKNAIAFYRYNSKTLYNLLALHKALKGVRNNMNHADENIQYDVDKVKLALEFYVKWLEELKADAEKYREETV